LPVTSQGEGPWAGNDLQRLNGWKEIAAHLGKSVRTVQRWETEYQLPIRRIGGEIVFAFKNEIDEWSASRDQQDETPPGPQREVPVVAVIPPARYWRLPAALVLAMLTLGGAYFSKARLFLEAEQPVAARIESRTLVALSESGKQLWRRELDFEPDAAAYASTVDEAFGMKRIRFADLDDDGANEVVLSIASIRNTAAQGYRVFNADGSLRYAIEPSDRVTFGDVEYAGPWTVYRMFIIANPDGSRSIWTVFIHSLYFPTLLMEVDHAGAIKSKYWSNGYIEDVGVVAFGDRRRVLVAGTHNDSRGASLAIFDYGAVAGAAPAVFDKFRCKTCDRGGPARFLVFPRQCIAEAVAGQAAAQMMKVDAAGRVFLFAGEGPRNPGGDLAAGVWYTVDPQLEQSSMQFAVASSLLHNRLENAGRLSHSFSSPMHLSEPGTILEWADTRFVAVSVRNLTPTNIAPGAEQ
jgi:hypothetical protein